MSDEILCPECNARQKDLWDHEWGSREELVTSCGTCGADYVLLRRVSVSYEARRLPPGSLSR